MSTSSPVVSPPISLQCRRIGRVNPENWDDVQAAFAGASICPYQQYWLESLHPRFLPGQARTGYDDNGLWILAEFEDIDIHNPAIELNEEAFKVGDVFEIFLRALPLEEYIEFHVTPENQKLQLWWPRTKRSHADDGWKSHYLVAPHFESWTQVFQEENCWSVLCSISYDNLNTTVPHNGHEWLFSFSRYDYTRGRKRPVLSSTSLHTKADFHRHQEWGRLIFQDEA